VEQWRSAVERRTTVAADDPMRDVLEKAAQPPSPVMLWTREQTGTLLDAARTSAVRRVSRRHARQPPAGRAVRIEMGRRRPRRRNHHRAPQPRADGRRSPRAHPRALPAPARSRSTSRLCACCASTAAARSPTGSCGALRGRTPWTGCSSARTVRCCTRRV
jgi:hypothetical protein